MSELHAARRRRGRSWLVVMVALVAALVGATSAQAAVTTSSITTPADPAFAYDSGSGGTVTVSGTSNGTTGDNVDIDCYTDDGSSGTFQETLASGVPVQPDGTFSAPVDYSAFNTGNSSYQCRLRAVPSGTTPSSGLSSFAGPRFDLAQLTTYTSGGKAEDYYLYAPQLTAGDDYYSYGDCGLDDSYLFDPVTFGHQDATGFYCNDYLYSARIGGADAFVPNSANPGLPGYQPLTVSATQDAGSGDLTITETDPFVVCATTNSSGACATYKDGGVKLTRTITQDHDGHVVLISDQFASTDGQPHALAVTLENDQHFQGAGAFAPVSTQFPGQAPQIYGAGDSLAVPGGAGTILFGNGTEGAPSGAHGALTYSQAPSGNVTFTRGGTTNGYQAFIAPWSVSVPASGTASLKFGYDTEFTSAGVASDVTSTGDQVAGPAISIASPANGSTSDASPVAVTGAASAGSGVRSVVVNGLAATVSNGSWTASSVPLHTGANTITATVTSNGGNTASTSETVTYTPPASTAAGTAPLAVTGAASSVTASGAKLAGTVTPNAAATSYMFQLGTSAAYGLQTPQGSLPAGTTATAVSAVVHGLRAHTLYHYRLVASSAAGISYGPDRTFTTLRPAPRAVTVGVSPGWDHSAPYSYRTSGKLTLPAGVSAKTACRGTISVQVKRGSNTISTRRTKLGRKCDYTSAVSFSGSRVRGHGRLKITVRFAGNGALGAFTARPVFVRYG